MIFDSGDFSLGDFFVVMVKIFMIKVGGTFLDQDDFLIKVNFLKIMAGL